jgi:hypothetical protein
MRPEKRSGPPTTATRSHTEDPTKEPHGVLSLGQATDKTPHWTGCPAGCGEWHECGVGEPIEVVVDFAESAVFVGSPPRLSSLSGLVAA